MRRRWICAIMVGLSLIPRQAQGQQRSLERLFRDGLQARDNARRLTAEGHQEGARTEWAKALKLFRMSRELDARPGVILNLAICEEQLLLLADALAHYKEVLAMADLADDMKVDAMDRMEALAPRVPRVRLELAAAAPPETRVEVDGAALASGEIGHETLLNPGPHVVYAVAPGYRGRRLQVTLAEGEDKEISIDPGPRLALVRLPSQKPDRGSSPKVLGWSLVGGGAAALTVGGALFGVAAGDLAERDENNERFAAGGLTFYADRANDAADRASLEIWLGVGAAVSGAALVGTGIYFLSRRPEVPRSKEVSVAVSPTPGGLAGAALIRF